MRNIQTLNGKMWKANVFILLAAFCLLLFLPGCRNALDPQDTTESDTPETGIFSLIITRQGTERTVTPDISLEDFVKFRLDFAVHADCNSTNADFSETWEGTYGMIKLAAGIWSLTVTAFLGNGEEENPIAIATGSLRIDMVPGGSVEGNVALSPVSGGQGTFHWDISFDESSVVEAWMTMTRLDVPSPYGLYSGSRFFDGRSPAADKSDSAELDAGQYRVIFTMVNDLGTMAVLMVILHIYQDMDSFFTVEFTPDHFGVPILDFVMDAWTGSSWDFVGNGISAGTLIFLGIDGVNENNFPAVVRWFNALSVAGSVPNNLAGLKRLTDAALIGVASEDEEFLNNNFGNRAEGRTAILGRIRNNTSMTLSWTGNDKAVVRIGGYELIFSNTVPATLVTHGISLSARLAWLRENAQSHNYYIVEVDTDDTLSPTTAITGANQSLPTDRTSLTITIRGVGGTHDINLLGNGSHFWIPYGVTLILDEGVTLQGRNNNTNHLVRVNSGSTLRMNAGSRIVNNVNTTATVTDGGGGVRVNSGGVFILDGGEVSGNFTTNTGTAWNAPGLGGGVRIESGGIFTMFAGTISGNEGQLGGGVWNQGTFRMSGGVIYGNEATIAATLRNRSRTAGSASLNNAGTAQRGTFSAVGTFSSLGSLTTTSNTIRLLGGIGQPTGVTVSPTVAYVARGGTRSFTALILGLFSPSQIVVWSIVELDTHMQTSINNNGVLSVAVGESLATFTVRATSAIDDSVYGETTVTVLQLDQDGSILVPGTTLATQLAWLRENASNGDSYLVEIRGNETIAPTSADTGVNQVLPTGRANLTIILRGNEEMHTVSLSADGSLFWIPPGVTLVLDDNVTLQGRTNNTNHLVRINSGGTLIANAGSRIADNQNATATATNGGGGILVNSGGVFIMDGGEISGNSTTNTGATGNGGGVRVESGGRFDMRNGTISGNAGQNGGGVWNQGTFRMSGGVIYGNEATIDVAFRNTSRTTGSASLSHTVGGAHRGTFNTAGDFTTLGNLSTTSNTIRLENGLLAALTGTVSITGIVQVGQTITANIDALGGIGTPSFQWKRGTTNIAGATGSTYVVQSADAGHAITVTVSRAGYSGSVVSLPTAVVPTPPTLTGTVSIMGIAQVGQTLTVNVDALGGIGTTSFQWRRGATNITGATGSTYVVQPADAGHTITVTVSRAGYSGSVTSTPTAIVATITWSATASGNPTTTAINFTFSAVPTGLVATDFTITSGTGTATRGVLSGTGTTRTLTVSGVSAGTVSVSINRAGIASGSQAVTLVGPITWSASASGSPTTTAINFTFSAVPTGLVATDFTITSGTGTATRGVLSGTGTTRTLTVSNVSTGTVSVSINRAGIASGSQAVTLVGPITWSASASGSPTTTAINFTFSAVPTGLVATDFTIISGTGTATRGVLSGTGTTRPLTVSGVSAGTVSVSINRAGIVSGPQTVTLVGGAAVPGGITLTASSPSATVNVTAGVNGRVPVTITAPAHGSVVLVAAGGTSTETDPAIFNGQGSAAVRLANPLTSSPWTATLTIPTGQTMTVFVGTNGNVARSGLVLTATFP